MPEIPVGPKITVDQLQNVAQHLGGNIEGKQDDKGAVLLYASKNASAANNANHARATSKSPVSPEAQGLAKAALYEALSNTYSEEIADHVFGQLSGRLFNENTHLSSGLIANAVKAADAFKAGQPISSVDNNATQSVASPSNAATTAVRNDNKDKQQLDADNAADNSVIVEKKKAKQPLQPPPVQSRDDKQVGDADKSKPVGASASSNTLDAALAKRDELRQKSADALKTLTNLQDQMRATHNKHVSNRRALIAKKRRVRSGSTGRASAARLAQRLRKHNRQHGQNYLQMVEEGGNKTGIPSFGVLFELASPAQNDRLFGQKFPAGPQGQKMRTEARQAILKAFESYSGPMSGLQDTDKTRIAIRALREYLTLPDPPENPVT